MGVHRRRGGGLRQAGSQPRRAGDVEALLADLAHAAADDLPDLGGIDVRALDDRRLHDSEQIGRVDPGESAASPADRRADRIDDVHAW